MNRSTRTATTERPSRPLALRLYVAGALFLGISALYGGLALMLNPDDEPLGLPTEWLDGTPFRDYFLPGATLFGAFGVGSFVVLRGVLRRRAWGRRAAVGLGAAQVAWIVVEILLLRRLHPLHALYGSLGVALVVLARTPSFRTAFRDA